MRSAAGERMGGPSRFIKKLSIPALLPFVTVWEIIREGRGCFVSLCKVGRRSRKQKYTAVAEADERGSRSRSVSDVWTGEEMKRLKFCHVRHFS